MECVGHAGAVRERRTAAALQMNTTSDVARLDAVVRSLHDAVCLVDGVGRVVSCNDEFRNHWIDTFGRSPRAG